MFKFKISLMLFLFISGCSGYEFVYKDMNKNLSLQNKFVYLVDGEDEEVLLSGLKNAFGQKKEFEEFVMIATIEKTTKSIAIDNDGTASRKEVEYKIFYKITNISSNCNVFEKTITTKSIFNSKSSGYNFSTDLSEKASEENNIRLNISNLSNFLVSENSKMLCINEG